MKKTTTALFALSLTFLTGKPSDPMSRLLKKQAKLFPKATLQVRPLPLQQLRTAKRKPPLLPQQQKLRVKNRKQPKSLLLPPILYSKVLIRWRYIRR